MSKHSLQVTVRKEHWRLCSIKSFRRNTDEHPGKTHEISFISQDAVWPKISSTRPAQLHSVHFAGNEEVMAISSTLCGRFPWQSISPLHTGHFRLATGPSEIRLIQFTQKLCPHLTTTGCTMNKRLKSNTSISIMGEAKCK